MYLHFPIRELDYSVADNKEACKCVEIGIHVTTPDGRSIH
jgi:hypothetical protein